MKKLFISVLACMLLVGCTDDFEVQEPQIEGQYPVTLYNEIVQVATTRVNDSGFCNGDGVGIYVVNQENGAAGTLKLKGNQADNVKYVYEEGSGKWNPETPVYFRDKKTHVDIYGYYPYSDPTSIEEFPYELAKDQSTDAANGLLGGYEASDFLWGKSADIAPTTNRISLKFRHAMASVVVQLAEGTGFTSGEWTELDKSVLVTNTIRKARINLATGVVTPEGEVPTTGTVPHSNGDEFRAIVVPQSVPASTALFSITVDGVPYVFRKSAVFEYVAGKTHKFTIEISKKSQSGLEFKLLGESITAWESDNITHDGEAREYVVIDCTEPGGLAAAIAGEGKDAAKIKNLKVRGTIDQRDFEFMKNDMTALQSLNLKEVEIAAYSSKYYANEIPSNAFGSKSTLIRFVFPDKITKIGNGAFVGTNLTGALVIPNGVTEIGSRAFHQVSSLTGTLTLPKSLVKIGGYAFYECSGLVGTLDIPSSVKYIENHAFYRCDGFTGNLHLPEGLEVLEGSAFMECRGFSGSLKIPEKITKIENSTFRDCGFDGQLILPRNLTEIEDGAFYLGQFRGSLELPETLVVIGENAFNGNRFSGRLVLPPSLAVLKSNAFANCGRLTGVVEIPENIISIASGTFAYCSQLEGVVLPKGLESIREGVFNNCYQLNSITCKANTPPTVVASAFNGVAKDNFTVEVPEAAVADYATAPVWKEFKRFAAHRDFSISRNLFRTLNATDSKKLVLRAPSGEAWSVESKPEWVTVSPSSGVGKTEVTITVDAMAQGAGNRTGEVVFLLDGKDYRSRTTVEQYDYTYGDGDVLTHQTASRGRGVNLVFMGDCFDAKDISEGKYLEGVNTAIEHFFALQPYKAYRDYFNVYVVFGLSPDSGVGTVNTIREARFGSMYSLEGITPDEATTFTYACKSPTVDASNINQSLVTMVLNTTEYGGKCYMWGDGSAIACCPMSEDEYPYDYRGLVQHEAGGHGFGKLGDEYIYHNAFIQTCGCTCCPHVGEFNANKARGWFENLSLTGNMHDVPWSHMIFDPDYSNKVDIYEGGYMHARGVFRSEPNSCMNNNIPYYSAISRQAIVKRIMEYAGEEFTYEKFKANDSWETGVDAVGTRAMTDLGYGVATRQEAPVYMGEKPQF